MEQVRNEQIIYSAAVYCKLMKDGKVDLSKFTKNLPGGQGKGGPDKWRIVKDFAGHAGKAWKLYKELERIASLLEDGTIYGK